jgi:nucleoside diphosphate kinase
MDLFNYPETLVIKQTSAAEAIAPFEGDSKLETTQDEIVLAYRKGLKCDDRALAILSKLRKFDLSSMEASAVFMAEIIEGKMAIDEECVYQSRSAVDAQEDIAIIFPETCFTVAVFKPDALEKGLCDELSAHIALQGFEVVIKKEMKLSREEAAEMYDELKGKTQFWDSLLTYMSRGPILALLLKKPNAIRIWRRMIGNGTPSKARKHNPKHLRALYGDANDWANAVHGSDSISAVEREFSILFPECKSQLPNLKDLPISKSSNSFRMTSLKFIGCTAFVLTIAGLLIMRKRQIVK